MLRTTILKVIHVDFEEARKLLPYIKKADVFSLERAAMSEAEAIEYEKIWEDILRAGSRTLARKMAEKAAERMPAREGEYVISALDYLFRNNVPLWCAERFSPEESRKLMQLKSASNSALVAAHDFLKKGQENLFLERIWLYLTNHTAVTDIRDREIARNIDRAEGEIVRRYPSLAGKQEITFMVCIGGLHTPERYVRTAIEKPVTLAEMPDSFLCTMVRGATFDQMKEPMLEYGRAVIGVAR